MNRLARVPAMYIVIACVTWAAFVVLLPRLMVLAMLLYSAFRHSCRRVRIAVPHSVRRG